ILIPTIAAALALSFAAPAVAAKAKRHVSADIQASCKAQAAKKFSAIHFMKRRNFTNDCVARHANAKSKATTARHAAAPKAQPTTTGMAPARDAQTKAQDNPKAYGKPDKH